jgi:hypothetical protein
VDFNLPFGTKSPLNYETSGIIIEVVLGAFAHMDACPLLITSIIAVKPEDQGTFS